MDEPPYRLMRKYAIIKNKEELGITEARRKALEIIEYGIHSVLPHVVMQAHIAYKADSRYLRIKGDHYDLSKGRIFVIGGGKASGLMAASLESFIPPDHITKGIVNCNHSRHKTQKIRIVEAGHPIPDHRGLKAAKEMMALKASFRLTKDDTVISLISGGGSALLPYPADGITIEDQQNITRQLLASGAEIGEINIVRKHLSKIKGGQLGRACSPARVISLIISDVIDNKITDIASGPTAKDPSTFRNAYDILEKYGLQSKIPGNILNYLDKGLNNKVDDTPKTLPNCKHYIIGDNCTALNAVKMKAKEFGYHPKVMSYRQKGPPDMAALSMAKTLLKTGNALYDVILIGGETTPVLPERHGKGGRNQHYAAVSMLAMRQYPGKWTLVSAATDGSDYMPNIAGAVIDEKSLPMATSKGIDVQTYIDQYDSYHLFKRMGSSLLKTSHTGTNVGDIIVYILEQNNGNP